MPGSKVPVCSQKQLTDLFSPNPLFYPSISPCFEIFYHRNNCDRWYCPSCTAKSWWVLNLAASQLCAFPALAQRPLFGGASATENKDPERPHLAADTYISPS